jgi:hypothetical protein
MSATAHQDTLPFGCIGCWVGLDVGQRLYRSGCEPSTITKEHGAVMTISTRCNRCGREFEPTTESVRAGTWRTCPACKPAADADEKAEVQG